VKTLLAQSHPDEIERALYEADHVSRAFAAIDSRHPPFDVVHDHCGFTALAMADRLDTPMIHTVHGPFTPATGAFYAHHGHKAGLVGISDAQLSSAPEECEPIAMIRNPIELGAWPLQEHKQDYVLWVGRITPEKGPHRAIAAARMAGVPLVLAGVIQPGQQAFFDREIAPHIDGSQVRFLGEIRGSEKRSVFADARALLMPIRWDEPFGMVMVEALACGTPVISFAEGAANELVLSGSTGFLVPDEPAMAGAIGLLGQIEPRACRAWVAENCDADVVAEAYEDCYRAAGLPLAEQLSVQAV
jgi:glycosyltransferase involved in cell wall biosynthesis